MNQAFLKAFFVVLVLVLGSLVLYNRRSFYKTLMVPEVIEFGDESWKSRTNKKQETTDGVFVIPNASTTEAILSTEVIALQTTESNEHSKVTVTEDSVTAVEDILSTVKPVASSEPQTTEIPSTNNKKLNVKNTYIEYVTSDDFVKELLENRGTSTKPQQDSKEKTTKKISESDASAAKQTVKEKFNVLFIMSDDMRPQLDTFHGQDFALTYDRRKKMHTPNLNALAAKSILFKRAYAQYSLCGPSRTSMLTSRRPDTTRVYGNHHYWRDVAGNFTTLPQFFKNHGYKSVGIGKIFHKGKSSNDNDVQYSWTEYYSPPYVEHLYVPNKRNKDGTKNATNYCGWKAVTLEERKKIPLTDDSAISRARKYLREMAPKAKSGEELFFMAIGFLKPHMPLVCPKEYFDLFPLEADSTYLPHKQWQTPIVNGERVQLGSVKEGTNKKIINDNALRELRRAYSACISYVDSLVGVLMQDLKKLELDKKTVVVFMSDHGYHLGENRHWGKVKNYEMATHIPLMIHIPGRTDKGMQTRALVEAIDVFPTVAKAAGLKRVQECPPKSADVNICTEGKSLLHLIDNPLAVHKTAVYSQVAATPHCVSYTIRTDHYRFTEWGRVGTDLRKDGLHDVSLDWEYSSAKHFTEFYDLSTDPEEHINRNSSVKYAAIQLHLRRKLHKFVAKIYEKPKHLWVHR